MKKILLIVFISSFLNANELKIKNGDYIFSELKDKKGVIFGEEYDNGRGAKLTLKIKNDKILVNEEIVYYNYKIKNNNLYIRKENNNKTDILKYSGKYKGCIVFKYIKKEYNGFYKNTGYKLCPIKK